MPLSRLIYFSENHLDPKNGSVLGQLSGILSASNRNNKRVNITGALVFDDFWFIQVLEGEREVILRTFERLKDDERHLNIALVELTDIDARMFGNWWMGLATRNETTQAAFAPYLRHGKLHPEEMTGHQLLALVKDVAKLGLNRQVNESTSCSAELPMAAI
jgi:hypothetical protein